MSRPDSTNAALWTAWRRSTRFLESARLAFARERNLWETLEIGNPGEVELLAPAGQGSYKVSLVDHIETVNDEEELYSAVLIQGYAIAEAAAADKLELTTAGRIEDWGSRLLASNERSWSDVLDGKGGLVEVAVMRNLLAHGIGNFRERDCQRLVVAGARNRSPGDPVGVNYDDVRLYRDRLRSLLRLSGFQQMPQGQ